MKKVSVLSAILVIAWATAYARHTAHEQFENAINDQDKSAALKTLDANSLDLSRDLDSLHERMNAIKDALQTTGTLLRVPGVAHKQLIALETSLSTADRMLQTAEVVPQTREKAKRIRAQTGPALTKVTTAKQKIGAIAVTTDPLSAKFLKAAKRLGQADTVLVAFNAVALRPEPFATTLAQGCVNGAAVNLRQCMQQKVDEKAGDVDKVVVELDRVVELLLTDVGTIEGILPTLPAINTSMGFLDDYQKLLAPIIEKLDTLVDPLRNLDDLLNRSFGATFPYPDPTITNPLRTSDYTVSVSMRIIVQGAGAVEHEIERILGGILWTAAKAVGIDNLVRSIIDGANGALDPILKQLNLDFDINLGDIDAVINLPAQLEVPLPKVDLNFDGMLPELDVNSPSLGFPGFAAGLSVKSIDPSWFNPGNLKPGDIQVVPCQQGLFLCKDEGERCDRSRADECVDDLICRPRNDKVYYCVQKGSAQQGDLCDRADAGAGGQCAGDLVCRNTGPGYACVGRGEPQDLCAQDDAESKSCGGNLLCRNVADLRYDRSGPLKPVSTWRCIGSGNKNDFCAEEAPKPGIGNPSLPPGLTASGVCGGSLKCRSIVGYFKCVDY